MKQLPLRPNVCMLVFNREKKLFLGERHGEPGVWQFPQGGVEPELSPEENVIKELNEELGAGPDKFKVVKKLACTHEYEWKEPPEYARRRWRGQSQTFWLVEFVGQDSDIDLKRFEPELMSWRWCTPAEVRCLAEPKRLPGYLKALKEFEEFQGL